MLCTKLPRNMTTSKVGNSHWNERNWQRWVSFHVTVGVPLTIHVSILPPLSYNSNETQLLKNQFLYKANIEGWWDSFNNPIFVPVLFCFSPGSLDFILVAKVILQVFQIWLNVTNVIWMEQNRVPWLVLFHIWTALLPSVSKATVVIGYCAEE